MLVAGLQIALVVASQWEVICINSHVLGWYEVEQKEEKEGISHSCRFALLPIEVRS